MKKFSMSLEQKRSLKGLAFITPFLIGFLLFFLYPFLHSVILSFNRVEVQQDGYRLISEGIGNYKYIFRENADYNRTLVSTVIQTITNVPLILIFSFFAATLLNQKFKGRTLARAVLFLPVIVASGVIMKFQNDPNQLKSLMEAGLATDPSSGTSGLQSFELSLMLHQLLPPTFYPYIDYLTGAVNRIYELVNASGVQILIFLAALQSIPPAMFEASYIEGATGWENFWKITFPMISSWFMVNTVYSIVDTFTAFNNGMMKMIDDVAFTQANFGRGAAMAWIYFLVIMVILAIVLKVISKRVFYYE